MNMKQQATVDNLLVILIYGMLFFITIRIMCVKILTIPGKKSRL